MCFAFVGNKEKPRPRLDFLGREDSELELAIDWVSGCTLYREVAERLLDECVA